MGSVPNQPKTPHRTIRVPDEVWLPAKVKAESEGSDLSKKIREWLTEYVSEETRETVLGPGEIRVYGNMPVTGGQMVVGPDPVLGLPFASPPS